MDDEAQQRICGILGGLSYVSTTDYYNQMNELVGKSLPGHGSCIHIVSVDIFSYVELLNKNQSTEVVNNLLDAVHQLVKSGIDFLLIASNTGETLLVSFVQLLNVISGHIAAPRITEYYPNLVFIHISDAVAYAVKEKKLKKVGFLGTKFTMKLDSCVVSRLLEHNLDIVFPRNEDIDRLHQIILTELNSNIFTTESKQFYISVMQRLFDEQQVEGIVLGCTEIPQLVRQNEIPHVPLFDSTQLHVQLAVDYQLGRCDVERFLPVTMIKKN
ncbi:unnamed protein product [Rotaria socialis]|uniref:Aspartate racemase n=1 Tax=Rotaria socialis TaxID=392032 RepID=A0A820D0P6_9BILA|nr:unnamed protein product [Rotaria socialis]CAF4223161.1 unnamed protein product [Rotaria socialis]